MKQRLDFSDKNGLQLSSDFLQIQVKKSLKQWWDFSDKKGLQLCSDLLNFEADTSLKQRLVFSLKTIVAIHFSLRKPTVLSKIATMVTFPLISS